MDRLSVNQFSLPRRAIENELRAVSDSGIRHMGIMRSKWANHPKKYAEMLCQCNIEVSDVCIIRADPTSPLSTLADARATLELAAACNADLVTLVMNRSRDHNAVIDVMNALVEVSMEYNIPLGLEPLHPMYANVSEFLTFESAYQFVCRWPSRNLGIVLDTYHVWWDRRVYALDSSEVSRIRLIHVGDWPGDSEVPQDRVHLGQGLIDFRALVTALEAAGYKGLYEMEVIGSRSWALGLDIAIESFQKGFRTAILPYLRKED